MAKLDIKLWRDDGLLCVDTSTDVSAPPGAPRTIRTVLAFDVDLAPGSYAFGVGLYDEDWATTYDFHKRAYRVAVTGVGSRAAVLQPTVTWRHDAHPDRQ